MNNDPLVETLTVNANRSFWFIDSQSIPWLWSSRRHCIHGNHQDNQPGAHQRLPQQNDRPMSRGSFQTWSWWRMHPTRYAMHHSPPSWIFCESERRTSTTLYNNIILTLDSAELYGIGLSGSNHIFFQRKRGANPNQEVSCNIYRWMDDRSILMDRSTPSMQSS